jgi:hypothetical protein
MPKLSFVWDLEDDPDGNVAHIAEHGIMPEEVEEVLEAEHGSATTSRSSGKTTQPPFTLSPPTRRRRLPGAQRHRQGYPFPPGDRPEHQPDGRGTLARYAAALGKRLALRVEATSAAAVPE